MQIYTQKNTPAREQSCAYSCIQTYRLINTDTFIHSQNMLKYLYTQAKKIHSHSKSHMHSHEHTDTFTASHRHAQIFAQVTMPTDFLTVGYKYIHSDVPIHTFTYTSFTFSKSRMCSHGCAHTNMLTSTSGLIYSQRKIHSHVLTCPCSCFTHANMLTVT